MKTISCKDMGVDCPWIGKAEDMDQLAEQVKTHAQSDHKEYWDATMSKMSDEDIKKMMEPQVKEG